MDTGRQYAIVKFFEGQAQTAANGSDAFDDRFLFALLHRISFGERVTGTMQRKIRGRILVRREMRQSGCSESLNSNIKPDVRMARVSGTGFRLVPHLQVFDQTPSHTIFGATPRELESARGASSSVNAQQKKKKLRM